MKLVTSRNGDVNLKKNFVFSKKQWLKKQNKSFCLKVANVFFQKYQ